MSWEIRQGDALERLREMPDESVQCCVTSPPYWGLRDYGIPPSDWPSMTYTLPGGDVDLEAMKCCLGLEPTPEQFVGHLTLILREVFRVLRADGTLWLNLGDSYAAGGCGARDPERWPKQSRNDHMPIHAKRGHGRKAKDLIGVPWLVAFALQADGWYLRKDIIWSKTNPMPESVADRPTTAHEHLFLLSKSSRYFYDAAAIREEDGGTDHPRNVLHQPEPSGGLKPPNRGIRKTEGRNGLGRNKRSVWEAPEDLWAQFLRWLDEQPTEKGDVWKLATRPFPAAHFATFPPDLVEPCVLAGSTEGDTVLDFCAGASTTGLVAARHNRDFIGIELNPEYVELGRHRIRDDAPLINTPAEVEPVSISGGGL